MKITHCPSTLLEGYSAYSPSTLASYFGRISYNFDERYMFQATVRRGGSSNFGSNNKWATFPSFSLSICQPMFYANIFSTGFLLSLRCTQLQCVVALHGF